MADARFFTNSGPLSLADIASLTGAELQPSSEAKRQVQDVAPLDTATASHISFLDNTKYLSAFSASNAGACFARAKFSERAPKGMALLLTENPYLAFAQVAARFYPPVAPAAEISPLAHIDPSTKIAGGVRIEAGAVVEANVEIGRGCIIRANAVIHRGVVMGEACEIGACSTLSHCVLGNRVVVHRGVHIGQDGFGYAATAGAALKVPQLGRVLIGDDVEIGSGTCIDRGAGPDTVIGAGTKIDNLVQIGHNAQLGRGVIVVAQVGIGGSNHIGDGAVLGGQSGFSGHIRVGAGAKIAGQSGVITDVPAGATYGGYPAVPIKDWHRQSVTLARLIRKGSHND